MFYALSKILDLLAAPLTWALLLMLLAFVRAPREGESPRARRLRRAARFGPGAAIAVLVFFSLEPVSNALMRSLEEPRLAASSETSTYDAVVLLGGFVDARVSDSVNEPAWQDGVERMLVTYDLLRTNRATLVIVSSGDVDAVGPAWTEPNVIAAQLRAWGIAQDRIVVEDKSRNTRENALFTADIVRAKGLTRLLLVTSAFHMRRALGCFEAVGLHPDPRAVDFHSFAAGHRTTWLPRAIHLANSTGAIREWLGRIVYRVRGFSTR